MTRVLREGTDYRKIVGPPQTINTFLHAYLGRCRFLKMMDFETAKLSFVSLVSRLGSQEAQNRFHSWLKDYVSTAADQFLDSEVIEARINIQVTHF